MSVLSSKNGILQLVSLLYKYDIRHVVVCPGSRNAPIIHTLAASGLFACHAVTDERSAGFVAIGLADATNSSVAVCCTSGSAVLNLAPAVVEAFYRHVPLLVVSADRPYELIGQMDGQTIEQNGCFGLWAKTYNLRENDNDRYRNRLINEALANLTLGSKKPVHINVQINEPLFDFVECNLPDEHKTEWEFACANELSDNALREWGSAKRKMIVIGQKSDYEAKCISVYIDNLTSRGDTVVLAEHLSNMHNKNIISRFDDVLSSASADDKDALSPELIVYVGGHIVSKRLKQFLRERNNICWHLSENDSVIDVFQSETRMIKCNITTSANLFFETLLSSKSNGDFAAYWHRLADALPVDVIDNYCPQSVVGKLINILPPNCALSLANSSSVRYAQHFHLPDDVVIICNRGVNGIEGSLSTAVGYALATSRLVVAITGDLSFFYDSNALYNNALPNNLRIVLLNDGGGSIFSSLAGLERSSFRDSLIAASHDFDADGIASSFGCKYLQISDIELVDGALKSLFLPSERAVLAEFKFDSVKRQ